MRVDKPAAKEELNKKKHGIGFSLADRIFTDPLAVTVYDRHEHGEDRWHTFGLIHGNVFLVVHTYPDPDNEDWVRVIGLRLATSHERQRYEEGLFD